MFHRMLRFLAPEKIVFDLQRKGQARGKRHKHRLYLSGGVKRFTTTLDQRLLPYCRTLYPRTETIAARPYRTRPTAGVVGRRRDGRCPAVVAVERRFTGSA